MARLLTEGDSSCTSITSDCKAVAGGVIFVLTIEPNDVARATGDEPLPLVLSPGRNVMTTEMGQVTAMSIGISLPSSDALDPQTRTWGWVTRADMSDLFAVTC